MNLREKVQAKIEEIKLKEKEKESQKQHKDELLDERLEARKNQLLEWLSSIGATDFSVVDSSKYEVDNQVYNFYVTINFHNLATVSFKSMPSLFWNENKKYWYWANPETDLWCILELKYSPTDFTDLEIQLVNYLAEKKLENDSESIVS